ncbi:MAG: hypothetical protein KAG45_10870 [Methyloprofundus sp.]|nr:hypothetical protein [Methyloprofundus sp.]
MNINELQAEINAILPIYAQIESGVERDLVKKLLNLIERVVNDNESLEAEIQQLRDEVNRLKGEQGKPDIKPNKNAQKQTDISSEAERKKAEAGANKNEDTKGGKNKRNRKPSFQRLK